MGQSHTRYPSMSQSFCTHRATGKEDPDTIIQIHGNQGNVTSIPYKAENPEVS